jgi:hypothetical protein
MSDRHALNSEEYLRPPEDKEIYIHKIESRRYRKHHVTNITSKYRKCDE